MTEGELALSIRKIGLALSSTNGCITTDIPDAEPSETSWRVDHSEEISLLDQLMKHLNIDSVLVYGDRNTLPLS